MRDLSDKYDRLAAQARSLQPSPEDRYQRLSQLYTSVRTAVDELRNDCAQYTFVMRAWEDLLAEHRSEDIAKARSLLRNCRLFFSLPAFYPKQLDEKQTDLLEHLCRIQQRIEDIVQSREDAARLKRSSVLHADKASSRRALSATEPQRTNRHRETQPPSAENIRKNASEAQPPPTHRTGWEPARGGAQHRPQRSGADNATAAAPSRSVEVDNAARLSRGRGPHPDRLKAPMSSFASSAGAGRTTTSSSGPLQVGTFVAHAKSIIETCALCSGPHSPSLCARHDTTAKRLRRVQKLQLCLLCLEGGHRAVTCPKKIGVPCRHCGHGEHHHLLCKDLQRQSEELTLGSMRATTSEHATKAKASGGDPCAAAPREESVRTSSPIRSELQPVVLRQLFKASPGGGRPLTSRCADQLRTWDEQLARIPGPAVKGHPNRS
ncbi:gag protein [Aphelenchoides avenae]|nr:gag protein [Aphelenchus avenae]